MPYVPYVRTCIHVRSFARSLNARAHLSLLTFNLLVHCTLNAMNDAMFEKAEFSLETICIKKIIQSHFYHKDACKMRLDNFLYTYGYAAMQVCLDRSLHYANRYTEDETNVHLCTGRRKNKNCKTI